MTEKVKHKYNLFFAGYEGSIEQIGLAQSNDFENWEIHSEPVVPVGNSNDFDALQTSNPYVFKENGHYTMFYQARSGSDKKLRFGRATSYDLIDWEKAKTPYFELELETATRGKRDGCQHPHMVQDGENWNLFFTKQVGENTQFCIAQSNDMQNWNIEDAPCLKQHNGYETLAIYYPWIIKNNDTWLMWYSAVSGDWGNQKWVISRAISKDGQNWERNPIEPVQINEKTKPLTKLKNAFSWKSRIQGYANPCVVNTGDGHLKMLTHAVMKKSELTICLHQSADEGKSWETLKTGLIRNNRKGWCHKFDADPFLLIS